MQLIGHDSNFVFSATTLKLGESKLLDNWRSVSQSVSQSVSLGVKPPGSHDQILVVVKERRGFVCRGEVVLLWLTNQLVSGRSLGKKRRAICRKQEYFVWQ
jgi:hypothetical protein